MSAWLTREQAAERVGRDRSTIARWIAAGLPERLGLIREEDLLNAEREARSRRGRPRGSRELTDEQTAALLDRINQRLDALELAA